MDPTLVKNEKKGEKRFIIRGDRESVTTQEEKRARSIIARRTERINDKATHTEKSRLSCFPFGHHFGIIHDVSILLLFFFPPHFFFLFFFYIYIYIYKFSLSPLISHGQLLYYYYYPLSLSAERQKWNESGESAYIAYIHLKCGAVVIRVLCFSGSYQRTAHPQQQHALAHASSFWYV